MSADGPVVGEPASHRFAFDDSEFLRLPELRSFRLALEYAKPQLLQRQRRVEATVVVFGSARVPAPEHVDDLLVTSASALAADPDNPRLQREHERVCQRCELVRYYEQARRFASLVAERSAEELPFELVVTTGGGPGIMEAANRGASEMGRQTMGLNIQLPHEQAPNPYISPDLCFNFHYFAIRKMHLMLRAKALVIFPGGFGTLDEFFEALTLVQTGKVDRMPIIAFGQAFWSRVLNLSAMVEAGTISVDDPKLIQWVDTAEEAWEIIRDFYAGDDSGAVDA